MSTPGCLACHKATVGLANAQAELGRIARRLSRKPDDKRARDDLAHARADLAAAKNLPVHECDDESRARALGRRQ